MVDITGKPEIYREARAEGFIKLKPSTIEAIVEGRVRKGDVITVARIAAINAVKMTPRLIVLSHPIPITGVDVSIEPSSSSLKVYVTVRSESKTGVELEALVGVTAALLNIFDMVKPLEKDEHGLYPETLIYGVRVIGKVKGGESKL
ncbi:MAG: cyclic pyranopterin monophosphate synthase MoaC [Nitrososphaerota archaeon]|nr:cyclic pyranopterin monophosphate synthase MoaC [Candidatus Bathyarchaeota archaeon]MCX8161724.1 cyclic pyranopterin monophosphate synthase MoaC [Candidatus Bathyarchaeota archaeon]MDW8061238.1 cyclic pyranopterin monophosphate synthase MoaC [Nitrososphaerota archaeon]